MRRQLSSFLSMVILLVFCLGSVTYAQDEEIFNDNIANEILEFEAQNDTQNSLVLEKLMERDFKEGILSNNELGSNRNNVYEREPNNYTYQANNYILDDLMTARFAGYPDLDYFKFTITKPGIFFSVAAFDSNVYTPYLMMGLFDVNDNILAASYQIYADGRYWQEMYYKINPGTYYIVALQDFTKNAYSTIYNVNYSFIADVVYDTPLEVLVSSVKLNKSYTEIEVGTIEQLTATVNPYNATNKSVKWTSNNSAVATVDSIGNVRGAKPGVAIITATSVQGGKQDICYVTVKDPGVKVTGINLNKNTTTLKIGGQEKLVATVFPINATNKKVMWRSDNPNVVSVDSTGMVRGLNSGVARITATSEDGLKTAECYVLVDDLNIKVTGISLNKNTGTLFKGQETKLVATVLPLSASNKTVIWTSSDLSVASVDSSGLVKAINPGTSIIYARTEDGNYIDNCIINVGKLDDQLPILYNITFKKAYYDPITNNDIDMAIAEIEAGSEFAKLVGGKLVNYNDYRNKVMKVIITGINLNLSNKEISGMLAGAMPAILSELPEIKIEDSSSKYELNVVEIY